MGLPALRARLPPAPGSPGPDATQPRVTVRPKPPVLLGATSSTDRWRRAGSCRTIPARAGRGGSREATATHHGPSQVGSSCPLRSRSPRGARSLPSIPPCSVLSASPRSALRLPFGLPSLPPCGGRLRFGGLSSPNWRQVALPVRRGQCRFAKSRRSPHLSPSHPQAPAPPSPVLPHGVVRTTRMLRPMQLGPGGHTRVSGLARREGPHDTPAVPPHAERPGVGVQPGLEPGAGRRLRRGDGGGRARTS